MHNEVHPGVVSGNLGSMMKTVFNPTPVALSWRWDGIFYTVNPGDTLSCPMYLAEHLLKHLRSKGLRAATLEDIQSAKNHEHSRDQAVEADSKVAEVKAAKVAKAVQEDSEKISEVKTPYKCNAIDCNYTNDKESGVLMHQRTKHREVTYGK